MSRFTKFQIILVTFLIGVSTFYGGYYLGKRGFVYEVKKNPPSIQVHNQYPGDQEIDFALFWEVWDLVGKTYLERPVDGQKMMYGAIQGMVAALEDPYTSFLPPQLNETVMNSINGTYYGIGAELDIRDNQLMIVAPLDGSPAEEAGVQAGDFILKIEDESTAGITLTEAVSKIRGEIGTISTLTLQRVNSDPFVVQIKRGAINIEGVTWEDKGEGTVYMRISTFGADTNEEWTKAVKEINAKVTELDAIILDVRGNPGGYLQAAVYIAEEFFRGEPVLYQETATGEQIVYEAKRTGSFESVPRVIVLIDEGSASASEILAAALKTNKDAILVGEKSFGKGTIQDAQDFEDGSGVHITVAKWLTPNKEWVHKAGITPDEIVERTIEHFNEGVDPQLDKAIELANEI